MLHVIRTGTFFLLWLLAAHAEPVTKSIRAINFNDFVYAWREPQGTVPSEWRWIDTHPTGSVRLIGGKHAFENGESLSLSSVTNGDLTGDGREEAAVDLLYSTGGTANWHYLYLYTIERGQPLLLAHLKSGSRADGGLVRALNSCRRKLINT